MSNRITRRRVLIGAIVAGALTMALFGPSSTPVAAHGGGLDSSGCHNDRKAGTYHCHRGPCQGKTFASKAAMLRDACSKGQE